MHRRWLWLLSTESGSLALMHRRQLWLNNHWMLQPWHCVQPKHSMQPASLLLKGGRVQAQAVGHASNYRTLSVLQIQATASRQGSRGLGAVHQWRPHLGGPHKGQVQVRGRGQELGRGRKPGRGPGRGQCAGAKLAQQHPLLKQRQQSAQGGTRRMLTGGTMGHFIPARALGPCLLEHVGLSFPMLTLTCYLAVCPSQQDLIGSVSTAVCFPKLVQSS